MPTGLLVDAARVLIDAGSVEIYDVVMEEAEKVLLLTAQALEME